MELDAFNLTPGLAVRRSNVPAFGRPHTVTGETFSVVGSVRRDADLEIVSGRFRSGEPFVFDYSRRLTIVGVVVNVEDHDDTNLGTEFKGVEI